MKQSVNNFKFLSIVVLSFGVLFNTTVIKAQNISANAQLDSSLMFIGGQMNLILELNQPNGVNVGFPVFNDTISKCVEIVERGNVDTLSVTNDRLQLRQIYRITSFDSGVHLIPPIEFELADETAERIATDPIALKVINPFSDVDPEKGIFDIKKPINTPFHLSELKPYIGYILGFLVLVGAIIFFFIWKYNRKLIAPLLGKEKVIEPPHVIALRELERIKGEKLWQKDQTKKYYSELTEVLRKYIEDRFQIPALEQISEETIAAISKVEDIDDKNKNNLKQILELADLVKFAKFQPLIDENDLCMINSVFFVNQTKHEEVKSLEDEKKALEDKEQNNEVVSENNEQEKLTNN